MYIEEKLKKNGIYLLKSDIKELCKKYHIIELSIFGSSLRDDFHKDSDIDFLVSFNKNAKISLFDIVDLKEDLKQLVSREVDIVEKEAMKNPFRKKEILLTREVIYAY